MKSTLQLDLTGFQNLSGLIQHGGIDFMHVPYLSTEAQVSALFGVQTFRFGIRSFGHVQI